MDEIAREQASLTAEYNADKVLMNEHPCDEAILKAVSRRARARTARLDELKARMG